MVPGFLWGNRHWVKIDSCNEMDKFELWSDVLINSLLLRVPPALMVESFLPKFFVLQFSHSKKGTSRSGLKNR